MKKYTPKDDPLLSSWTQSWSFHFDFSCFSIKTNSCRIMNKTFLSLPISQCSSQGRNVICTRLSHRNWLLLTVKVQKGSFLWLNLNVPKWFFQGTCIDYLILMELQQKALLKLKYDSKQAEFGVEKTLHENLYLGIASVE